MSKELDYWLKGRELARPLDKPFSYEVLDLLWMDLNMVVDALKEKELQMAQIVEKKNQEIDELDGNGRDFEKEIFLEAVKYLVPPGEMVDQFREYFNGKIPDCPRCGTVISEANPLCDLAPHVSCNTCGKWTDFEAKTELIHNQATRK